MYDSKLIDVCVFRTFLISLPSLAAFPSYRSLKCLQLTGYLCGMVVKLYIVHKYTYIRNNKKSFYWHIFCYPPYMQYLVPFYWWARFSLWANWSLRTFFTLKVYGRAINAVIKFGEAFKTSKFTANYKWVIPTPRFVNWKKK